MTSLYVSVLTSDSLDHRFPEYFISCCTFLCDISCCNVLFVGQKQRGDVHRCRLSFEMNFLVTEKFSLVCFFSSQDKNFL